MCTLLCKSRCCRLSTGTIPQRTYATVNTFTLHGLGTLGLAADDNIPGSLLVYADVATKEADGDIDSPQRGAGARLCIHGPCTPASSSGVGGVGVGAVALQHANGTYRYGDDMKLAIGEYTTTFVARDAAGNTATCGAVLRVVDTEAPVLSCPANTKPAVLMPGQRTAEVTLPQVRTGAFFCFFVSFALSSRCHLNVFFLRDRLVFSLISSAHLQFTKTNLHGR